MTNTVNEIFNDHAKKCLQFLFLLEDDNKYHRVVFSWNHLDSDFHIHLLGLLPFWNLQLDFSKYRIPYCSIKQPSINSYNCLNSYIRVASGNFLSMANPPPLWFEIGATYKFQGEYFSNTSFTELSHQTVLHSHMAHEGTGSKIYHLVIYALFICHLHKLQDIHNPLALT